MEGTENAGSSAALDGLTDDQRRCVHEYCAITNTEDIDAAVSVLKAKEWSVQLALHAFFEPTGEPSATEPATSDTPQLRQRRPVRLQPETPLVAPVPPATAVVPGFSWLPLLTWPFHLVLQLTLYIAHILLSIVGLGHIVAAPNFRLSYRQPSDEPGDFTRYFERTFGATHPPFFSGTYTQALEAARAQDGRQPKYLVVILWSKEHDDMEKFGRALAHSDVVAFLGRPEFVLWVGDVAMASGYQAAMALGATQYPFVALAAQRAHVHPAMRQPRIRLEVAMRLNGLSPIQRRMNSDGLARTLVQMLRTPLDRADRAERAARQQQEERREARRIVEMQDQAYQASLERDRERERVAREQAEKEREEREREEKIVREQQQAERMREQWRWAVFARIQREQGQGSTDTCKLNLRLDDGSRELHVFSADASLQHVFDFVETRAVAAEWASKGVTPFGPSLDEIEEPVGYEHEYDFVLVSQFPRCVFDDRRINLRDALAGKGLWPSATLIVEPLFDASEGE
ncbi:Ubx domain-containing protein [Coemansia erecta]|uniref:Ubx domain-containing protein n=1 Tax=Coemansia erecta TaxID=147472 RepID=A0A9W7XXI1_9FUNG|nr:Ubx domain-containing protein [Coemansia erecta]